jgi:hypothetical protein
MMSIHSKYTIEVARDLTQVLALRPAWQELVRDPNADMDFYLTVIQSRSEILRPHVIVLKRGGVVHTILVGRVERKSLEIRLGYGTVSLPSARILTLIHGGLLGHDSEEHVSALAGSVLKSLAAHEADVAWFYGLDADSAFYRTARNVGGFFTRDYFPGWIERWKVRLPSTYEELHRQLSANTRHNLKRYSKRLGEASGGQLTVKSFRDPSDVEWVLRDTEVIAAKSYHRGLGVGFVHNDENSRLMKLAGNQGWLRAHILYLKGRPCAFWNGFLYGKTFFTSTTGYDPDFRDYRPGTFLLQKMFEDLCAERVADEVDFGFGDAQYKRDWCADHRLQASLFLFAPSVKGVFLNSIRTPLVGASNVGRRVLARTGTLQRLKRAWRDRLANSVKPQLKRKTSESARIPRSAPSLSKVQFRKESVRL